MGSQQEGSTSEKQLYLIDQIKKQIDAGVYREREFLPSEFSLAKQYDASRTDLKKALEILEEANIITIKPGFGSMVNPKPLFSSGIEELNSVTETIEFSGRKAGSQYLSIELIQSTEEDREKFRPREVRSLVQIERIRTADSKPIVFNVDKIPDNLIPLEYINQEESMFQLMEKYAHKRISYAVSYIEPISYHERIYDILDYDPEQSLLLLKQMHYTEANEPVLYSLNYYRPDMTSFHVVRRRA